jgi:hypothetical protein
MDEVRTKHGASMDLLPPMTRRAPTLCRLRSWSVCSRAAGTRNPPFRQGRHSIFTFLIAGQPSSAASHRHRAGCQVGMVSAAWRGLGEARHRSDSDVQIAPIASLTIGSQGLARVITVVTNDFCGGSPNGHSQRDQIGHSWLPPFTVMGAVRSTPIGK